MSEKYDEKARMLVYGWDLMGQAQKDTITSVMRGCAAQAYEDAAKIVYAQSRNRPAKPDALAKTFISKAVATMKGDK